MPRVEIDHAEFKFVVLQYLYLIPVVCFMDE